MARVSLEVVIRGCRMHGPKGITTALPAVLCPLHALRKPPEPEDVTRAFPGTGPGADARPREAAVCGEYAGHLSSPIGGRAAPPAGRLAPCPYP